MSELTIDERAPDAPPPASNDFYEALARPRTPEERAALRWRLPSPSRVVVSQDVGRRLR